MSVISEYVDLVNETITNQTEDYSITPGIVGNRITELAELVPSISSAVPLGTILMYSPVTTVEFDVTGLGVSDNVLGWAICNGNNSTPNLKGKFVVGYDPDDVNYDTIGETGGQKYVTEVIEHTHYVATTTTDASETVSSSNYIGTRAIYGDNSDYLLSAETTESSVGLTSETGIAQPDNRPHILCNIVHQKNILMPIFNGLPAGNNKCIGSYANESSNKLYTFIYNSEGNHTLNEYDSKSNKISIVLKGDFLNFQENEYINGVGVIDNNFIYWTDGYNEPRGIDISKAKSGDYYKDSLSINLIKQPPQQLITAQYIDDSVNTNVSNRLKDQFFQFRYLYVYEDGSRSAWSSCSKLPLPNYTTENINDSFKNNGIALTFNIGTKQVKTIEIAAQVKGTSVIVGTTDWFSIFSLNRDTITGYNTETNLATVNFFNDGLYQSIDVKETDLSFDFVPLKSKALDIVNGNVLVLGNNTEGYDNIDTDVSLYVQYETPVIDEEPAPTSEFVSFYLNANVNQGSFDTGYPGIGTQTFYQITDDSSIQTAANLVEGVDDLGSFFITDLNQPGELVLPGGNWEFSVFASINFLAFFPAYIRCELWKWNGSTLEFIRGSAEQPEITTTAVNEYKIFINDIPDTQLSITDRIVVRVDIRNLYVSGQEATLYTQGTYQSSVKTTFVKQNNSLISKPVYKTNSKQQFGLVYYDDFNRSSYVQTDSSYIINTDSWGETEGKDPVIYWSIRHEAPLWAKKYQWVRTEQLTHKNFLFWVSSAFSSPAGKDYYELDISGLLGFNADNPNSILNYSWTAGDRCTIHKADGSWITDYDVEIVGYVVEEGTATLQIEKKSVLTAGDDGILLEIYTPKTRANVTQEQFFYEFGEQYDCNNGVHSITESVFREGDIYVKKRNIPGYPGTVLEDPNFSDFLVSNFSSNGRTNIYAPQAKQLTLPTDIRYSDTYVPNTNINGLSRFYGSAYETYDRVNGSIQKLATRDNYLLTFQEHKTGYIPIEQSIIEDQGVGNQANVAISSKLLNKIRYFAGDYGIGLHPESFARFAGTVYFADPNRGMVMKLSNGLQPISSIGMDGYFTKNLSDINMTENSKILGGYDPRNDEYVITLKKDSDLESSTVAYSEMINRWTTFYSFIPENSAYIFNQYFTFKNGNMYAHNINESYNTFYGQKYDSVVTLTYNQTPLVVKSFIGLIEQSTSEWIPKTTANASQPSETILVSSEESAIKTNIGQASSLDSYDFSFKEGVYFASLLRDFNSPGGLFEGDDLKGNWIKLRLVNDSPIKESLLSVDVRHIPSYQGIK